MGPGASGLGGIVFSLRQLLIFMKTIRNHLFGKYRHHPIARVVAQRAEKIVLAYKNFNYDFATNGEEFLLRDVIAPQQPRVIFDVGANVGDWAVMAAKHCPDATIHAFEIVPATADICAQNVAGEKRIILNRFGLADKAGEIPIRVYDGLSTHSSAVDFPHNAPSQVVPCPAQTGDDYVRAQNVAQIDLLLLDVEGAENRVMAGFAETLRLGKIRAIQFEYGRANILSKFLLRDWYELLTPLGYKIGKLYPTYVDYKPYDLRDEDFIGPNYVAVRE
jgi:FkbM family methyltransferase